MTECVQEAGTGMVVAASASVRTVPSVTTRVETVCVLLAGGGSDVIRSVRTTRTVRAVWRIVSAEMAPSVITSQGCARADRAGGEQTAAKVVLLDFSARTATVYAAVLTTPCVTMLPGSVNVPLDSPARLVPRNVHRTITGRRVRRFVSAGMAARATR